MASTEVLKCHDLKAPTSAYFCPSAVGVGADLFCTQQKIYSFLLT